MSLKLGNGKIEIFISLLDESFIDESRNIDKFLDTFQKNRHRPRLIKVNRLSAGFLTDL